MILWFLLLVGTLASTSDASVLSTIDITRNTTLSNLTSNNLRSQSNSSVAEIDFRISYCTKKQTWSVPEVKPDDCCGVLDYFYLETVDETFRKSKEFKAPGAKKTSRVPTQTTPRKYTFGREDLSTMFPSSVLCRICPTMKSLWFPVFKSQSLKSQ